MLSKFEIDGLTNIMSKLNLIELQYLIKNKLSTTDKSLLLTLCLQKYDSDASKLLNKRSIKKYFLLEYIDECKIWYDKTTTDCYSKYDLINAITNYWALKDKFNEKCVKNSLTQKSTEYYDYDECKFTLDFVNWFSAHVIDKIDSFETIANNFWIDCFLKITFEHKIFIFNNPDNIASFFKQSNNHELFFMMNKDTSSINVRIKYDNYITTKSIVTHGILYKNARFLGIFDQIIGVEQDSDKNNHWYIKFIEIIIFSNFDIVADIIDNIIRNCSL